MKIDEPREEKKKKPEKESGLILDQLNAEEIKIINIPAERFLSSTLRRRKGRGGKLNEGLHDD